MKSDRLSARPGYEPLAAILDRALAQAQAGKGNQRHQIGETPFLQQPICQLGRMLGGPQGECFQAMKKTQEAMRLDKDAAVRELLGAINYLSAAVILLEETMEVSVGIDKSEAYDDFVDAMAYTMQTAKADAEELPE